MRVALNALANFYISFNSQLHVICNKDRSFSHDILSTIFQPLMLYYFVYVMKYFIKASANDHEILSLQVI